MKKVTITMHLSTEELAGIKAMLEQVGEIDEGEKLTTAILKDYAFRELQSSIDRDLDNLDLL
tara:strand:- start:92 stop:277 length:186 start_codon:yes stop_codon:yes gene_type:complete